MSDSPRKLLKLGDDFVILPLYGVKKGGAEKVVFPRSGINQWNAAGRRRDPGEVYLRIPRIIHNNFPDFFPPRDSTFTLKTPTGELLQAKVCQEGGKAIMTNPNKALAEWLIKRYIGVEIGTLITYDTLERLGFDAVVVTKESATLFHIDKAPIDSYEQYISGELKYWGHQE